LTSNVIDGTLPRIYGLRHSRKNDKELDRRPRKNFREARRSTAGSPLDHFEARRAGRCGEARIVSGKPSCLS